MAAQEAGTKIDGNVQYYCNLCRVDMKKWSELCLNCKAMGHTWARTKGEPIPLPCDEHNWQFAYKQGDNEGSLCDVCGAWKIEQVMVSQSAL